MYADKITPSMAQAIDETNRRRAKQVAYNEADGRRPAAAAQEDRRHHRPDRPRGRRHRVAARVGAIAVSGARPSVTGLALGSGVGRHAADLASCRRADLADLIQQLNDQMHAAAAELQFELAARLRDEIRELKKELRGMQAAGHA